MKRETSSKQLSEAAVAHLREKGQVVTYPAEVNIVRRGKWDRLPRHTQREG